MNEDACNPYYHPTFVMEKYKTLIKTMNVTTWNVLVTCPWSIHQLSQLCVSPPVQKPVYLM